jgi:lipopolysaccharide export system protein LptA
MVLRVSHETSGQDAILRETSYRQASDGMGVTVSRPRFTIERLRTLVLVGGLVLVAAIAILLVGGHWTRRFLNKDLPNRLGINIEQQADGKTIFKIHAARAVTMKGGGNTLLHDVRIELYGEDGNRTDTISGSEFQYDPSAGVATAAGAVEITMMRPGVKPAISQMMPGSAKAKPQPSAGKKVATPTPASVPPSKAVSALASEITDDEIHVKTSGLTFHQKDGSATTAQRVDFALRQGSGNSTGATYDSQNGRLVLDRDVELHVLRGNGPTGGDPVTIHAGHAEFEHSAMTCQLTRARAEYTGGTAQTANALIQFREDGSVARLDGSGGVDLQTLKGSRVTAPAGSLDFDGNNHPRHGLLQGGTQLAMTEPDRQVRGTAPTAQLTFDSQGQLSLAHMEQGVFFNSQQRSTNLKGEIAQVRRSWKSQTADVAFAPAAEVEKPGNAHGQHAQTGAQAKIEPRTIRGYGGVVVTSETGSDGVATPSTLSADTMVAELAPGSVLSTLRGNGHASFLERTAAGVRQSSTSDQLEVHFVPPAAVAANSATQSAAHPQATSPAASKSQTAVSEIESVVETGHVVLIQEPPQNAENRAGHAGGATVAPSGVRATANRADYDGQSQVLHLTGTPRVRDGELDMTANRIDFARLTGDAFAHGDVRASWAGSTGQPGTASRPALPGSSLLGGADAGPGGNGPVHAIAAEAELRQASQEVIFRGNGQAGGEPRLWQSVNSVSAPAITLNRLKQTLTAEASGAANPVRTVLVSNFPSSPASHAGKTEPVGGEGSRINGSGKPESPSTIRVRSGDLHYSEGERLALFHGGPAGSVTAETTGANGKATIVSQEAEVILLPAGSRSGAGNGPGPANTSVDRLTARGRVVADWPDRRGTGEKLVYRSEDGTFTLTGTSAAPPRITDQARGTVTGSALIYHSRDSSVTVQGDGGKTETETRSPK